VVEVGDGGSFLGGSAFFSLFSGLLSKVPFEGLQYGDCGSGQKDVGDSLASFD